MDRFLERDIVIKVLAVVLALFLWVQVTGEQNPDTQRVISGIPVVYTNLDQGLVLLEKKPETISVKVGGLRGTLAKLTKENFTATADLHGGATGWAQFPLTVKVKAADVQLVEYPTQASARLDVVTSRQMDVQVHLIGVLGDDFANKQPVIKPSQVVVSGPRGRLDLIAKITGDIDLTGASDEIKRTVPVKAVDAQGLDMPDITIRPNSVDVTVSLVTLPPGVVMPVKGKVTGDPAPGYHLVSITTDPLVVKLRGDVTKLAGVDSVSFQPFSVAGVKGIVSQDAEIILPPGATMAEPRIVRVTVDIEEDGADKTINGIPTTIGGLAGGLSGSLSPATLSVTVRGPKSQLAGLTAKDIAASVNATGLKAGTYNLIPDVTVPNGFSIVAKDPATVTVTIK